MGASVRTRPVLFSAPMIRAILAGSKSQTRRVVTARNSTVLGYPAKKYWPHLLFEDAVPKEKSTLMMAICGVDKAPSDVHLSVPYQGPDDPQEENIDDLPWYRVRSVWEVGDLLWVREAFVIGYDADDRGLIMEDENGEELPEKVFYRATEGDDFGWLDDDGSLTGKVPWKPSIHMPRWASRLTLRIIDVKVERLHEISEADARAEGADFRCRHGDDHWSGWGIGEMVPEPVPSQYSRRDGFRYVWESINGKGSWAASPWVWVVSFERVTEVPA